MLNLWDHPSPLWVWVRERQAPLHDSQVFPSPAKSGQRSGLLHRHHFSKACVSVTMGGVWWMGAYFVFVKERQCLLAKLLNVLRTFCFPLLRSFLIFPFSTVTSVVEWSGYDRRGVCSGTTRCHLTVFSASLPLCVDGYNEVIIFSKR